jgi:hypothetical protein
MISSDPIEIMNTAAELMRKGTTARVRRNANSAYQHARAVAIGKHTGNGADEAMRVASHYLRSASVEHDATLKGTGEFSSPEILDSAYVDPTKHLDNWVEKKNEGLKNGS